MSAQMVEDVTTAQDAGTVVSGPWLRDALTACTFSMDKGGTLPVLEAIHVVKAGDKLTLTSTDRYRLTIATVMLDASQAHVADWSALVGKADVKRLLVALPKPVRYASPVLAVLTFNDGELMLDTGSGTVTVTACDGQFPNVSAILSPVTAPTERFAFNPAFMIDLCKMPGRDRHTPVALTFNGADKPLRSEWGGANDGVSYVHIIMPVKFK